MSVSRDPNRRRLRRRGAALYITVLGTALIVSLLGIAGLTVSRIERKQASTNSDLIDARVYSRSAVELGLNRIDQDPSWRTTYTNGVESTPQSLDSGSSGTISWIIEDVDGDLRDADTELWLSGIGRVGKAVQVSSVKLTSVIEPSDCLGVAVCIDGAATFSSNSIVGTDQTLHTNVSVSNSGTVNSDVDSVGPIAGIGYMGITTSPVPPRKVPDASVFDYYISNGTAIAYSDLPTAGPARRIMDVVLSPNHNPFGATNAEGVYVIDCQGGLIRIKFSRIIGTLVLLNPSPSSDIEDSLSMEPAVANYPSLLIQGGVEFRVETTPLSESVRSTNFNPSGAPYAGETDGDIVDTYPSQIKGLVYVSETPEIVLGDLVINGVFVAGNELYVTIGETLTVTYDSQFFSNPPPGFFSSQITPVPGSWFRNAAP